MRTLPLLALFAAPVAQAPAGFAVLARLDVGHNPHQIFFSPDGQTAWVAAAGSNRITRVDAVALRVIDHLEVPDTPLGVARLEDGTLAVARFGSDVISRYRWGNPAPLASRKTGGSPSLLVGPVGGRYFISTEKANKLWVLDARTFTLRRSYPTGSRPFPAGVTSDARLAFVPNYEDGTVSVLDLLNHRTKGTVPVGRHPSGGALLDGDIEYAVAVRGEDCVRFINTASLKVTSSLCEGIGRSPFSVVVGRRWAFVNNTADGDVSVLEVARHRVLGRIPVGKIPIVMALSPDGRRLWVSCEGTHELWVIGLPAEPARKPATGPPPEVAVMGMIHSRHRTSHLWGLDQVRQTIRAFHPDVVCAEIPPDRWQRIWRDYSERGVFEDERIRLFPEYTDVLLPLAREMRFRIEPCAGWTQEMSDLRRERIRLFNENPVFREKRQEYQARLKAVRERQKVAESDDPRVIHTRAYDEETRAELSLYDHYLNDWIGPGGWTHINRAHLRLINRVLEQHRGQRILITFGAGHKYWLLDHLRRRRDIHLVDLGPYLPERAAGKEESGMDARCRREVEDLHHFFQEWFRGSSKVAVERLSGVLAADFEIVSPEGKISSREQLLERLRDRHTGSSRGDLRIWIEKYRGRSLGPDLHLVTYEEWQETEGQRRGRLTTALFRRRAGTPNGVEWLHLAEVWIAP